jgi:hypothetical protein
MKRERVALHIPDFLYRDAGTIKEISQKIWILKGFDIINSQTLDGMHLFSLGIMNNR